MFGSPASSKDLNLPFPMSSPLRQGKGESGLNDHRRQQQMTNGLSRYRSAPSSLFGEMCEDFVPHRSSSPEAETMFARFLSPDLREQIGEKPSGAGGPPQRSPQLLHTVDHGASETFQHQNVGFSSSAPPMGYHASPPPPPQQQQHLTNHSAAAALAESSYRVEVMNNEQVKNGSNLTRHSSSPAGLFSHLNVENGLDVMRNMEAFRPGGCSNGEATLGGGGNSSRRRLKGQISFSSRQPSLSSALMSQIPEMGDDCAPGDRGLGHGDGNGRSYIPGLPVSSSWEDSSLFSDGFAGLKRPPGDPPEPQNGDIRNRFPVLSHHLSLPKSSSEMAAILQFQDAVPCKIRAKRGCATHPRSIAERVRRTRISERMRKLQELVPNMDKQTNTADMLDLAVEYIKDLQKQVKGLSESKANCTCSSN